MLTSVRACFRAEGEGRASLDATQRRRRHLRNPRPPFYRTLAALVLPQEEVMCCFPRARPDYESRGLRFSQKQKKKNARKGLAMRLSSGIARWWRSPGAAHAVSREGGEGEERAPRARRTAAGGRPGRTALRNVPPGSCAESFFPRWCQ